MEFPHVSSSFFVQVEAKRRFLRSVRNTPHNFGGKSSFEREPSLGTASKNKGHKSLSPQFIWNVPPLQCTSYEFIPPFFHPFISFIPFLFSSPPYFLSPFPLISQPSKPSKKSSFPYLPTLSGLCLSEPQGTLPSYLVGCLSD